VALNEIKNMIKIALGLVLKFSSQMLKKHQSRSRALGNFLHIWPTGWYRKLKKK